MNKIKIAFLFLLSIISFSACEKDDICVDGDTPLLIIRFYDAEDRTELKAVPSLRVVGIGQTTTVNTITDRSSTLDSISLPLRIDAATTGFTLITDSEDDDTGTEIGNSDILNFSYIVNEKFISRACGFVANFDDLSHELTTDEENWIIDIEVTKTLVTTETTTTAHVKIFH